MNGRSSLIVISSPSGTLAVMDKPQIILHIQKTVNYTLFDAKWIPSSAKFVVLGNYARGSGALQVYEVSHGEIKCVLDVSITILISVAR